MPAGMVQAAMLTRQGSADMGDHPAQPRKSEMERIMEFYKDRGEKQLYEHMHQRASTCLPSTADGHHPAVVLLHKKILVCEHVCEERVADTAQVFSIINELVKSVIRFRNLDPREFAGGRIDEANFRQILRDTIVEDDELGGVNSVDDEELDLMMHFVPVDKEGVVAADEVMLRSKLTLVLTLWWLCLNNKKRWLQLVQLPLHKVQLQNALLTLNQNSPVKTTEAAWIQEKFLSIPCEAMVEQTKLLLCIAYWYSVQQARPKGGLRRLDLMHRIDLEAKLWKGIYFFVLWVTVFVLFGVSLIVSGSLDDCRDIKGNLETQLAMDKAAEVNAVKGVYRYAKEFSDLVVNFVPVSEVYFGGSHVWTLQDGLKSFAMPKRIPPLMEPDPNDEGIPPAAFFISSSFSLQAWVSYPATFALPASGLSLLRKALPGADSSLSCWNWRFPPAFSYGAHDYGGTLPNDITQLHEEYIHAPYPSQNHNETSRSVLHTLLITDTSLTFMVDERVILSKTLPRPVTDCYSTDITMGDKGLTLASVRFFPRRLTNVEVAQIFRAGSTWKEIGRVVTPQKMEAMSEVSSTARQSQAVIADAEQTSKSTERAMWTASALVSASVRSNSAVVPYYNENHPIHPRSFDAVLGYPYWEIYRDPVYTDKSSKNMASGLAIPQRRTQTGGWTISAWMKFPHEGSGFFAALAAPDYLPEDVAAGSTENPQWSGYPNMCWMLWVGSSYTGFWARTAIHGSREDGPTYWMQDGLAPKSWHFHGKAYRHFVFAMNPTAAQPYRVCVDGVCTGQNAIDQYVAFNNKSYPPAASCYTTGASQAYTPAFREKMMNQTKLFMNRRPMDNWPLMGHQMQVKYYDRLLTKAEIKRLFESDPDPTDPGGKPIRQTQGCKLPSELQDNHLFRDSFGNNCYWYFQSRLERNAVCDDPEVRKQCPVACNYYERCWGESEGSASPDFQVWKQQMEFRTRGRYGTICVASSTTPEAEAVKCALNAPNLTDCHRRRAEGMAVDCEPRDCSGLLQSNVAVNTTKVLECIGNTRWVPEVDSPAFFVPCRDIIELNMPECRWNDSGLEEVTHAINSTGEWSVSFWYETLTTEYCAQPELRFLDGMGSTFAWVGPDLGMSEDIRRGNAWLGNCSKANWISAGHIGDAENGYRTGFAGSMAADVQGTHAFPGTKHFVVFGRRADNTFSLNINDYSDNQSPTWAGLRKLVTGKNFLRVINIVGDIRLSPMTLRSYYPAAGEIGYMRFSQQVSQDKRIGPEEPLQFQLQKSVKRKPYRYSQKTMLLAPPFILLRRNEPDDCPSDNRIVRSIHAINYESQCRAPYDCDNYNERTVYTCPSKSDATGKHFGHPSVKIRNINYYAEFLASITENAVIVREDDSMPSPAPAIVRKTREYVDVLTREATIVAFFYSVEFEIGTLLKIKFDTSKGRVVQKSTIDHFVAVQPGTRDLCTTFSAICLLSLVLIVFDMVRMTLQQLKAHRKGYWDFLRLRFWSCIGDFSLASVAFCMMVLQILQIRSSHRDMTHFLDEILAFDWDGMQQGKEDEVGDLIEVKRKFLELIADMESLFRYKSTISALSTVLSIVLLQRVVYTTNAHPRIELVTRTLELATSDLLHFFALMVIIFFGFALLGTWMFGARRAEFRTPIFAFQTLVDSVLGPPGSLPILDPDNSFVDVTYVIIFHFLCFFFMLNFVLAIIVDSYTKVMEEVRSCLVDQNVIADIVAVFRYRWLQQRHQFPLRKEITTYLASLDVNFVTLDDLYGKLENKGEEIFAGREAAEAFYNLYSRYSFLTRDMEASSDPTSDDLGTLMALVMHKVEVVHCELQDLRERATLQDGPKRWVSPHVLPV